MFLATTLPSLASSTHRGSRNVQVFPSTRNVLLVVATGFLLRLIFVALNFHSLTASPHFQDFGAEMGWTARSLALGQGFSSPFFPQTGPTALVPPLYPLLLSWVFRAFGLYTNASAFAALAINSLLSSLTASVIFYGVRNIRDERTALGAAWLWALYPYSVYYSAVYLWDFALTSLLFASCFFLCSTRLHHLGHGAWATFGALAGLAVLSNPSVLPLLMFLAGFAAWRRWRLQEPTVGPLLLTGVCLCAVLSPWLIRNQLVFHQPLILRDGFWGEFYAGNNGDTSHSNPNWTHPASSPTQMARYQQLGESGYMREKRQLAMHYVESHPAKFAGLSIRRFVRYWTGFWSLSPSYLSEQGFDKPNVPFCSFLTLVMLIGVWTMWKQSRRTAIPYVAATLLFPLPYYITHASIDYRQPIEPMIVVAITCGVVRLREQYVARAVQPTLLSAHLVSRPARYASPLRVRR